MSTPEVAKVNEISEGGMKRLVINDTAILFSKIGGEIYATSDRCGHENASLSRGILEGHEVKCALHGAKFDVRTGNVLAGPEQRSLPPQLLQTVPPQLAAMLRRSAELTSDIEVKPLDIYKVEVKGDSIFLESDQ